MKIYREIVRNTQMGIEAIDNVFDYIECDKLRNLALSQKEVLEDFLTRAKTELSNAEISQAKTNPMQKTMLKASVKVNAAFDNSASHIASMLIDGYNMGITSVQKCANELKAESVEVPQLGCELMKVYDKNIKALRAYL